jgi:hypothetical protein
MWCCRRAIDSVEAEHAGELHARQNVRNWFCQHAHSIIWNREDPSDAFYNTPPPDIRGMPTFQRSENRVYLDLSRWRVTANLFKVDVLSALMQARLWDEPELMEGSIQDVRNVAKSVRFRPVVSENRLNGHVITGDSGGEHVAVRACSCSQQTAGHA